MLARLDQIDGRLDDLARQQGSIGEQVAREADADAEARATGISAAQRAELDETERAARDAGERTSRAIDEAARAEAARDAQAQQIGGVPLAFATLPPGIAAMRAERRLAEAQAHRAALVPNEPTGRAVRAADLAVQRAEAELAYHRLRAARADVAFELDAAEDDAAVTGDARVREARTRWEEHRRRYQEASRDEADEADTPEEDHHA